MYDVQASHTGAPTEKSMVNDDGTFNVYIRLRTAVRFLVEKVTGEMHVDAFKLEIEQYAQGMPAFMQRLSFGGQDLKDSNTLS